MFSHPPSEIAIPPHPSPSRSPPRDSWLHSAWDILTTACGGDEELAACFVSQAYVAFKRRRYGRGPFFYGKASHRARVDLMHLLGSEDAISRRFRSSVGEVHVRPASIHATSPRAEHLFEAIARERTVVGPPLGVALTGVVLWPEELTPAHHLDFPELGVVPVCRRPGKPGEAIVCLDFQHVVSCALQSTILAAGCEARLYVGGAELGTCFVDHNQKAVFCVADAAKSIWAVPAGAAPPAVAWKLVVYRRRVHRSPQGSDQPPGKRRKVVTWEDEEDAADDLDVQDAPLSRVPVEYEPGRAWAVASLEAPRLHDRRVWEVRASALGEDEDGASLLARRIVCQAQVTTPSYRHSAFLRLRLDLAPAPFACEDAPNGVTVVVDIGTTPCHSHPFCVCLRALSVEGFAYSATCPAVGIRLPVGPSTGTWGPPVCAGTGDVSALTTMKWEFSGVKARVQTVRLSRPALSAPPGLANVRLLVTDHDLHEKGRLTDEWRRALTRALVVLSLGRLECWHTRRGIRTSMRGSLRTSRDERLPNVRVMECDGALLVLGKVGADLRWVGSGVAFLVRDDEGNARLRVARDLPRPAEAPLFSGGALSAFGVCEPAVRILTGAADTTLPYRATIERVVDGGTGAIEAALRGFGKQCPIQKAALSVIAREAEGKADGLAADATCEAVGAWVASTIDEGAQAASHMQAIAKRDPETGEAVLKRATPPPTDQDRGLAAKAFVAAQTWCERHGVPVPPDGLVGIARRGWGTSKRAGRAPVRCPSPTTASLRGLGVVDPHVLEFLTALRGGEGAFRDVRAVERVMRIMAAAWGRVEGDCA